MSDQTIFKLMALIGCLILGTSVILRDQLEQIIALLILILVVTMRNGNKLK